jgi:hypothetical protein
MVKPIHDSLYPFHFGLTLLILTSISIIIRLAWSNQCKVIFQIFIHTSKPIQRPTNIQYELCPLSFNLWLVFPHLCIFDSFFNPWSKLIHYQTLLIHARQAIVKTNPKFSTHVSFTICQTCLLLHDAMISHNHRSHFINSLCIIVLCLN